MRGNLVEKIWILLTDYWWDVELTPDQFELICQELAKLRISVADMEKIVKNDLACAFALEALGAIISGMMAVESNGITEYEMHQRMRKFYSRPRILWLLNPFRLVGYVLARWYACSWWPEVARRVYQIRHPR